MWKNLQFVHICSETKLSDDDRWLVTFAAININVVILSLFCRARDGVVKNFNLI